jgi:folate-binding protein YgfZ
MSADAASPTSTLLWADLERDVIDVSGADALTFLHSQLANDINTISIGETVHSLLLEPTGHVVALVRVVRQDEDLVTLDAEHGYGETIIARLSKFVLRAKVSMVLSNKKVRAIRGHDAWAVATSAVGDSVVVARPWWNDPDAADVIALDDDLPQIGEHIDAVTIDACRVDAGWPRMGVDIQAGDIPAATGVIAASVSFHKGCYPGQELVERMDSRGTVAPVVLRAFHIGDDVNDIDVTSRGQQCVLARVKRSDVRGAELQSLWRSPSGS